MTTTTTARKGGCGEVRHPLFARLFHRLSRLMEREVALHRDELLADLRGRVLELGAGNGINFAHYPRTVDEVVAIEPEPYLRAQALQAAARAPLPVQVIDGVADALPFDDASFDAAVCSLVLCSVPDQHVALAELRRVVRAGGELRFLEHVRSPHPRKASLQAALDRLRVWPQVAGGCHCARDTRAALQTSGFEIDRVRSVDVGPGWMITNPHLLGRARATQPHR
jgi:ubiquinone/menaquinone biosynthesis C-methylase UbiE